MSNVDKDAELNARLDALEEPIIEALDAVVAGYCQPDEANPTGIAVIDMAAMGLLLQSAAVAYATAGCSGPETISQARGQALAAAIAGIATIGRPVEILLEPAASRPADLHIRVSELNEEVSHAVAEILENREGTRSGDREAVRGDVLGAGLAMVLSAGNLLELILRDGSGAVICERTCRDLLHALAGVTPAPSPASLRLH